MVLDANGEVLDKNSVHRLEITFLCVCSYLIRLNLGCCLMGGVVDVLDVGDAFGRDAMETDDGADCDGCVCQADDLVTLIARINVMNDNNDVVR